MKHILIALAFSNAAWAAQPSGGEPEFNRFSPELPQLLETDSLTIHARGITVEMGLHVCSRVSPQVAAQVALEVAEWKKRNESFTKAAASAINEFANGIERVRGSEAKQSYLNQVLTTTAKASSSRVSSQFGGPSPDNALVPTAEACSRMGGHLRSGAADVKNNPEITGALRQYMAQRGMSPS